jgi:uncharacterized membrane protein YccC
MVEMDVRWIKLVVYFILIVAGAALIFTFFNPKFLGSLLGIAFILWIVKIWRDMAKERAKTRVKQKAKKA